MSDLLSKDFWSTLAVKSQVTLTDTAALEASQMQGRGLAGMEYVVEEILTIVEQNNLCSWYVCRIVNPEQELYLVAKIVGDEEVQVKVYYAPPAVMAGTRKEQVEANNLFLFRETKEDWHKYLTLRHASQISWEFNIEGGKPQIVVFDQKGNMELSGRVSYMPPADIHQTLLATISEYQAQSDCSDPEIMLLEIGNRTSQVGGVMKVLLGGPVSKFEVSILNAKKSPIVSGSSGFDKSAVRTQ